MARKSRIGGRPARRAAAAVNAYVVLSRPVLAARSVAVPTISRFFGITIAMYFDDHGHPHFHARRAGAEAKVRIDQIEVIESALPVRDLRLVLAWAELHQAELLQNWRRARAGETLLEIEPLR